MKIIETTATVWLTDDGKVHNSLSAANQHVFRVGLLALVETMFAERYDMTPYEIFEKLDAHKEDLYSILRRYVESKWDTD